MSVGSYNATFGTQGVKEHALFLKDVSDARAIRWKILSLFETANAKLHFFNTVNSSQQSTTLDSMSSLTADQEKNSNPSCRLSSSVAAPQGSEFAAELHDLITQDLSKLYPTLTPHSTIKLLDAGKSHLIIVR